MARLNVSKPSTFCSHSWMVHSEMHPNTPGCNFFSSQTKILESFLNSRFMSVSAALDVFFGFPDAGFLRGMVSGRRVQAATISWRMVLSCHSYFLKFLLLAHFLFSMPKFWPFLHCWGWLAPCRYQSRKTTRLRRGRKGIWSHGMETSVQHPLSMATY